MRVRGQRKFVIMRAAAAERKRGGKRTAANPPPLNPGTLTIPGDYRRVRTSIEHGAATPGTISGVQPENEAPESRSLQATAAIDPLSGATSMADGVQNSTQADVTVKGT